MRKFLIPAVVILLIVGLGFVVLPHKSPSTTTVATTATTTTTAPPIAPLTGLADPGAAALTRPALTVKIENTPDALPQWGIDQADVVYEEIVNGGITRLAAIFNSQAPTKVGPVRSVRPTDTQIVWPLGGIFAYSGGAAYAVTSIETVPGLKLVDESSAGAAMFRDPSLQAPHNLFASAAGLFTFGGTPVPPHALFTYRSAAQGAVGAKVSAFTVDFPSIYPVTWTWDSATGSWDRTLFGKPDVTGTNVRESPKNVIVMWVNYVNGIGTMASYADLQGKGVVEVFTDGKVVRGTWSRGSSKTDPLTYESASGAAIGLTPGQTWVELLDVGASASITK